MTYEKFMEQVKEQILSFFMQYVLNVQRTELFPMFILKIIIGHMRMMGIWKIF